MIADTSLISGIPSGPLCITKSVSRVQSQVPWCVPKTKDVLTNKQASKNKIGACNKITSELATPIFFFRDGESKPEGHPCFVPGAMNLTALAGGIGHVCRFLWKLDMAPLRCPKLYQCPRSLGTFSGAQHSPAHVLPGTLPLAPTASPALENRPWRPLEMSANY